MTDKSFEPVECWVPKGVEAYLRQAPSDYVTVWGSPNGDAANVRAYLVPPERAEWQPISTAPEGPKLVLLWRDNTGEQVIGRRLKSGVWRTHEGRPIWPTHWMPLPEGPP